MKRQHIIHEIHTLAEKIKNNTSTEADSLLTDAARLYEMVILFKHLPEEIKSNGQSQTTALESLPVQKEEIKIQEQPQITIDLFSSETTSIPPDTPPSISKKEVPKAPSSTKKGGESLAEKQKHKKISDLKATIGINEKFQFINELFDGNMKEYNVALDQLNNFASFDEAESYLINLEEVYKWQPDNSIAKNFKEMIKRRFA